MLPGQKYTPADIVAVLGRFWWLVLPALAVGLALGVFVFRMIPVRYQSETLIMVIPQRVPDEYVKSTVTAPIESRLSSISDQILSRSRLERIINDQDLYKKERAEGALMEDVVRRMRKDITVQVEGKDGFRVKYISEEPHVAQKVTERLASLFIDENLRDRENQALNTNEFLQSQLEDARRRLIDHERKLENYRQRYAGQLPTQLQGNLQAIQNAQLQLQSLEESTNRARERRLLLERQLADAQQPLPVPPPAPANATSDGAVQLTTAQQLELARTRLSAFKLRYTPDHPDVKALERTIKDLEAKLEEESKNPVASRRGPISPEEAARLRRARDLQAEIEVIDHQLAANAAEGAKLKATIAEYQSRVDALPERESELVELTRDYTTLQQTYASLLEKNEEAKLAANLERRQIGEQFKVLDPASLPQKPYNQRIRLGAIAAGALLGLALGVAIVGLIEYRDTTLKTEEHVAKLLGLPVIALIPQMEGERERRVRRLRQGLFGTATIVLALASAAAMLVWGGPA